MKKMLTLLCGLALGVAAFAAGSADTEFQVLQSLATSLDPKTPPPADATTGSARFHWRDAQLNKFNALAEQFMADHPADPRRWEVALLLFTHQPMFVKAFDDAKLDQQKPGTVVIGGATYDMEARAKHAQWLAELDAKCAAATDMTPEVRTRYELSAVIRHLASASSAVTMKKPVDIAALQAEVDRTIAKYPDAPETAKAFNSLVYLHKRRGDTPEQMVALLEPYADSASAGVRDIVQAGLMMKRAQDFPIDWKFTAADGREVDFSKLRGKVVLIDFWATWCHPCVEEIPNVVAAYNKYHDQGFEVVGMTLENAGVPHNATPEAAAAKLAAAKARMLAFTQEKGMPWPQYFDGTGWANPYTTKYGIRGIPAMFLLDQDGKVASLDARGAKLEAELKRLLKL